MARTITDLTANRSYHPWSNSVCSTINMKLNQLLLTLIAVSFLSFQGCSTTLFGNAGNTTPALSASTSSSIVVASEKTLRVSKDTIDLFLHLEYDNKALVKANFPQVHAFAETLRKQAPDALIAANNAKNAFKHNRNASNQASLMTAVATVSELAAQSQQYINKINQP